VKLALWRWIALPSLLLAGGQSIPQPFQISVDVNLVLVHPAVRDSKDHFVSDLRETDFSVFEDGVPQQIRLFRHEDVPVTIGLVIDHSGSMQRKMPEVIIAARSFVQSSNDKDQMFVVNFNERASFGLPKGREFSNRAEDLEAAIQRAPVAGQTALYDAVALALTKLAAGRPDKKVLVIVSDGGDNTSTLKLPELLKRTGHSDALIYAIGIFDADEKDRNPGVLQRLARGSGGDAFFPEKPGEVIEICERIARDIRNQYTLGYVPTNHAAAWRNVKVTARQANKPKLVVRARTGYFPTQP